MRVVRGALLGLVLAAAGCGKPVPPEKKSFVGAWQSPSMYLLITGDGSVRYRRLKAGVNTSIEGPLQGFEGDDFRVGVLFFSTRFRVATPPHLSRGRWRMVVDGVELTRLPEDAPGPAESW